jgi:hypothetical protein
MRRRRFAFLVSVVSLLAVRVAVACPLCADNLSKDVYGNQPSDLGRGFFWSIILMISAPFLTVGFVAVKLFLARQKAKLAEASAPVPDAPAAPV